MAEEPQSSLPPVFAIAGQDRWGTFVEYVFQDPGTPNFRAAMPTLEIANRTATGFNSMEPAEPYRCPECGYTHEDAALHMDHKICEAKGGPPMPPRCPGQNHAWHPLTGNCLRCGISGADAKRAGG